MTRIGRPRTQIASPTPVSGKVTGNRGEIDRRSEKNYRNLSLHPRQGEIRRLKCLLILGLRDDGRKEGPNRSTLCSNSEDSANKLPNMTNSTKINPDHPKMLRK